MFFIRIEYLTGIAQIRVVTKFDLKRVSYVSTYIVATKRSITEEQRQY